MAKKPKIASEPSVASGPAAARARKHSPAKRTNVGTVVDNSPSIDTTTLSAVAPATAAPSNPPVTSGPSFEEIAKLAYSYWEARGYQGGSSEEDWLRAEQELR